MDITTVAVTAVQYDALLCRYARFFVGDMEQAQRIVVGVFELYYDKKIPLKGIALRRWLQSRTNRACMVWLSRELLAEHQDNTTTT